MRQIIDPGQIVKLLYRTANIRLRKLNHSRRLLPDHQQVQSRPAIPQRNQVIIRPWPLRHVRLWYSFNRQWSGNRLRNLRQLFSQERLPWKLHWGKSDPHHWNQKMLLEVQPYSSVWWLQNMSLSRKNPLHSHRHLVCRRYRHRTWITRMGSLRCSVLTSHRPFLNQGFSRWTLKQPKQTQHLQKVQFQKKQSPLPILCQKHQHP